MEAEYKQKFQVFSSGGGVQSTAIASLIVQGKLSKPDLVVIADTGRECSQTWKYWTLVTLPAFRNIGIPAYRVGHEWFSMPKHGKDYISHNGKTILIGVWTNQGGQCGKLNGFCSKTWKQEAILRFLSREMGITRSQVVMWIGFSIDEWRRAQRIMVSEEGCKGLIRLPLIQDIPLTREQAITEVKKVGWPAPPRSRCWMCPNQADEEWTDLKERFPEEFQQAVEFEKEIQEFDQNCWLHKSCVPLDKVKFSKEPTLFDAGMYCNSGACFI